MHSDLRRVILVGAPNSGKTTLYNWMTGSRFKTVNYPGSTVEFCRGTTLKTLGQQVEVIDTPGIRSLDPLSPDEEVTVDCLYRESSEAPVLVVVPVDATQLERHLVMVRRLQGAGFSVVVSLTMIDLLQEKNLKIDSKKLSAKIGAPVFETDGRLGGGVRELVSGLGALEMKSSPIRVAHGTAEEIETLYSEVKSIVQEVVSPLAATDERVEDVMSHAHGKSLLIDAWLMHPVFGLIFFVLIMGGLFTSIFWMAQPAMDFIDGTFSGWAEAVAGFSPGALWTDLLGNGLIAGVGSVLVFLPQIVILFLVMGLLEDSGYLARAASLIDKPLSKIGLNGRSFVPLLSGYACAIPAMMAARTINNRKERLLTLFAIPLMSCSARLPVYALLLALLFKGDAFKAGLGLTTIYFASAFVGGLAATFAQRFIKSQGESWFLMELPAYRQPHLRFVLKTVWQRTKGYLRRAGPTIVVISLSIWFLSTFPNYRIEDSNEKLNSSYLAKVGQVMDPIMQPMGGDWRMGVGILSAFAAREVFVSTLAVVFRVGGESDEEVETRLLDTLEGATRSDGSLIFTTATIMGLIVYFMIALQCLPTVAVAVTESGSKKFALIQLGVFTVVAYLVAVLVVQTLRAMGLS